MGEGLWAWREQDHVNQEPGKSSSCLWSWFHGDEDVSGLSDSLCRWIRENQRFSRADCETAHKGEPQAVDCSGYRELVADPITDSRWTSTLHISVTADCPRNVHVVGDFPFRIDSLSNDFTMHVQGGASSKDDFQALYLEQTTLTLQLLSLGSSRICFNFLIFKYFLILKVLKF